MSSTDTIRALAEAFVFLTKNTLPDKITVSDIIAQAGKNRKTFYYHFIDKDHLIVWIFRHDLSGQLLSRFAPDELVYEEQGDDPCTKLPYYTFVKRGVRSLDGADFLTAFAATFEQRRSYYIKILRMQTSCPLKDYLYRLYVPALRDDIRFILSNRHLQDASIDFLAEFYAGAFLSYVFHRVETPGQRRILEGVGPFSNIIHTSLENEIKEQQLRRRL